MTQYAYEPWIVYTAIIVLLTASSFGLPIPEEFTLVSAGLLAYLASNPQAFPPPESGAEPVRATTLAIVCFVAVLGSDILVYCIGKFGGDRIRKWPRFQKLVSPQAMAKVEKWTRRHGFWMPGVFRFTPGIRFPGHLACGWLGIPFWRFLLVDGMAALLSVPTQVFLVAHFGEEILASFKQFKIVFFSLLAIAAVFYFVPRTSRYRAWRMRRSMSART